MNGEKHSGILRISAEMIGELLGIDVVDVRLANDFGARDIELLVSGDDLPIVVEGGTTPRVDLDLTLHTVRDGRRMVSANWKHNPDKVWAVK